MEIIGITGHAQHGKDTMGARLVEAHGFTKVAFADALRALAEYLNPYVVPDAGKPNRYRGVLATMGYEQAKQVAEFRRVLQDLGTGAREVIGDDVWVMALRNALDPEGRYVITDVRFPNEAAMIHDLGGTLVRVRRIDADGNPFDNGLGTDHPSEAHVDSLPADAELLNDGTGTFREIIDLFVRQNGSGVSPEVAEASRRFNEAVARATRVTGVPVERIVIGSGCDDACCEAPECRDGGDGFTITTEYEAALSEATPYERSRYRYVRTDKMRDDEHLDAVRGGGNGYGEGA
jgi:hypothetical protein